MKTVDLTDRSRSLVSTPDGGNHVPAVAIGIGGTVMQSFQFRDREGTRHTMVLYSLDEYEHDGGRYSDSGNGGEDIADNSALLVGLEYQARQDRYLLTSEADDDIWDGNERVRCSTCGTFGTDCDRTHTRFVYTADIALLAAERNRAEGRKQFVCAAIVACEGEHEDDAVRLLGDAGIKHNECWYDSAANFYLLRDWPNEEELETVEA